MMKRQENKQRFYLWDYLWWMGEKWKQARRTGRVDGEMMLSIYIFAHYCPVKAGKSVFEIVET